MAVSLEQKSFRFRDSDVALNSTTWGAAVDTALTVDVAAGDVTVRPRVLLECDGDAIGATGKYQLHYRVNGGSYAAINAGTGCSVGSSTNYATDDATAQLIGSGSFSAGVGVELQAAAQNLAIGSGDETEIEYAVVLDSADLSHGDTIEFRTVYKEGTDPYSECDTVTVTPTINVTKTAGFTDEDLLVSATATVTVASEQYSGSVAKLPGTDSGGYQLEVIISDTDGVWGPQEVMVQCSDIAGLNRSTDGGRSWYTVNRGFYLEDHYGAIGFLFSKYTKGTAYYIGVGNSEGGNMWLFKSENFDAADPDDIVWEALDYQAGAANKRAGLPLLRTHNRQMIEYDDGSNHYLLCASYSGVWRVVDDGNIGASDGGSPRFLSNDRVTSIVTDPNNDDECFATVDDGTTPGVYRVHNPFSGTPTEYRIGGTSITDLRDGMELCAVDNSGTTELVLAAQPRTSGTHGWIYHATSDPSTATSEGDVTWTEKTPSSGSIYSVMLWMSCDARYNGSDLEVVIGAVKEGSSSTTWMGTMALALDFQNASPTWTHLVASSSWLKDEILGVSPTLAFWWWDLRGRTWTPGRGTFDCSSVRFSPNYDHMIWASGGGLSRMEDYTDTQPVWEPAVNGMTCQLARSIAVDPDDDDKMVIGTTDFTQMSSYDGWERTLAWDDDDVGNLYNDTGLATIYHHTDSGKVCTTREEGGVTWYTDIYLDGEGTWTGQVKKDASSGGLDPVYGACYFDDASGNEITVVYVGSQGFRRSVNKGNFSTVSTLTTSGSSNKIVQGVYVGGGVGYFYHPAGGLFRFTDYGTTWTRIWVKTGNQAFTGYIDYDQDGTLWIMANKQLWHVFYPDDGTINADGTNATGNAYATQINASTFTRIGAGAAHPTLAGRFGVLNDSAAGVDSEFWVTTDGGATWTDEANGEFRRTGNSLTLMADCDSQGKFWFVSKGNNVYPLQTTIASGTVVETNLLVAAAGTVTATDVHHAVDDGLLVEGAGTVTVTDVQSHVETGLLVEGVATISGSSDYNGTPTGYDETDLLVAAAGTVTGSDAQGYLDEDLSVSATGTVTGGDAQGYLDEDLSVSVEATVTVNDRLTTYARDGARFYRRGTRRIALAVGTGRSAAVGFSRTEGWEPCSSSFTLKLGLGYGHNRAMADISLTWLSEKGGSTEDLTAAIDAALTAAGYELRGGS